MTPHTAWAAMNVEFGSLRPDRGVISAAARPTSSAANSVGDGSPTAPSANEAAAVAAPRTSQGAAVRMPA